MWWGGEPIWVTVERAGRRAATMFWPGSEAAIGGIRPTYWKTYQESMAGNERVDQALRWIDLPRGRRPSLVTLYFEDVDSDGHAHGPESPEGTTGDRACRRLSWAAAARAGDPRPCQPCKRGRRVRPWHGRHCRWPGSRARRLHHPERRRCDRYQSDDWAVSETGPGRDRLSRCSLAPVLTCASIGARRLRRPGITAITRACRRSSASSRRAGRLSGGR